MSQCFSNRVLFPTAIDQSLRSRIFNPKSPLQAGAPAFVRFK
jgi:hypothetical protein